MRPARRRQTGRHPRPGPLPLPLRLPCPGGTHGTASEQRPGRQHHRRPGDGPPRHPSPTGIRALLAPPYRHRSPHSSPPGTLRPPVSNSARPHRACRPVALREPGRHRHPGAGAAERRSFRVWPKGWRHRRRGVGRQGAR
ncbi:hypothetical protein GZL_07813 [Streptomyces sp. 769]|nr:hypothetical protein GZL_07813 [Streptomyces sp. 769]